MSVASILVISSTLASMINPLEFVRFDRDRRRTNDLKLLGGLIEKIELTDPKLIKGRHFTVYTSLPDSDPNCSGWVGRGLPILSPDYSYRCQPGDKYRNIDGAGWLPIDLRGIEGVTFKELPIDPRNGRQGKDPESDRVILYFYQYIPGSYTLFAFSEGRQRADDHGSGVLQGIEAVTLKEVLGVDTPGTRALPGGIVATSNLADSYKIITASPQIGRIFGDQFREEIREENKQLVAALEEIKEAVATVQADPSITSGQTAFRILEAVGVPLPSPDVVSPIVIDQQLRHLPEKPEDYLRGVEEGVTGAVIKIRERRADLESPVGYTPDLLKKTSPETGEPIAVVPEGEPGSPLGGEGGPLVVFQPENGKLVPVVPGTVGLVREGGQVPPGPPVGTAFPGLVPSGSPNELAALGPLGVTTTAPGATDWFCPPYGPPYVTDPKVDTDGDGLPDVKDLNPCRRDTDGDGLSDFMEVKVYGTNPTSPDTNRDGIPDLPQLTMGGNPLAGQADTGSAVQRPAVPSDGRPAAAVTGRESQESPPSRSEGQGSPAVSPSGQGRRDLAEKEPTSPSPDGRVGSSSPDTGRTAVSSGPVVSSGSVVPSGSDKDFWGQFSAGSSR